jgi:hypothetical protein
VGGGLAHSRRNLKLDSHMRPHGRAISEWIKDLNERENDKINRAHRRISLSSCVGELLKQNKRKASNIRRK